MSTLTNPVLPSIAADDDELIAAEVARLRYEHRMERESGIERIDGVILEKPVAKESSAAGVNIGALLVVAGKGANGWAVFDSSMGYKTDPRRPDNFRKPDVTAMRRWRMAEDADDAFFHIPADLAVEVISPNEVAYDVEAKIVEYLAHGVAMVWTVYPHTRTVYVHARSGSRRLGPDDTIEGGDVLPGFQCKVSEFFDN